MKDFNSLYNSNFSNMVRFAQGYVKDFEIAEDFVVEAFSKYWQNRKTLHEGSNPKAYILTIIKNKCLNYLEHLKVKNRAEEELSKCSAWHIETSLQTLSACNPNKLFSKEIQNIVDETILSMPLKTAFVYQLSRDKGLSYKEIAVELGVSVKTVEFHISKALELLRKSLRDFLSLMPYLILFL